MMGFAEIVSTVEKVSSKIEGARIDPDKMISVEKTEKPEQAAGAKKFDPDKIIGQDLKEGVAEKIQEAIDPDKLKGIGEDIKEGVGDAVLEIEKKLDPRETSYADRLKHTPGALSKRAEFVGKRGESLCVPKTNTPEGRELAAKLKEFNVRGIVYHLGFPDFSPVAKETVKIDGMSENRLSISGLIGNYEKADTALAKKWNDSKREGRNDWSARDVKDYRKQEKLTWHEKEDLKTMQLIPTEIHDAFRHSGGVAEVKNKNGQ